MRVGLGMILLSLGLVALSFGLVVIVLGALGARYGTPHATAGIVTLGFAGVGVILLGGGFALARSGRRSAR